MSRDNGIYFKRDDICKSLWCYKGFIPYRKVSDE